jgi:hypothetical protein
MLFPLESPSSTSINYFLYKNLTKSRFLLNEICYTFTFMLLHRYANFNGKIWPKLPFYLVTVAFRFSALPCFEASKAMQKQKQKQKQTGMASASSMPFTQINHKFSNCKPEK